MKKNLTVIYIIFILFLFALAGCSDFLTYNPNRSPSAVVQQDDYTVYPGIKINLNASDSSDIDNQPLRYAWKVINRPANSPFSLKNEYSDTAEFQTAFYSAGNTPYIVPNPTYLGTYLIKLTVYDEYNSKDTEYINVIVRNLAPTATILWTGALPAPGTSVAINGGTSVDPDPERRNELSFYWTVNDRPKDAVWRWNTGTYGTSVFIPSPVTITTVDFAPGTLGWANGEGVYTVMLRVTDEYGATSGSTSIIETSGNTAPTAAATVYVTNNGDPTQELYTNIDTTPAVIPGVFVTAGTEVGPIITLDATPSDNTGATRNLEQDTLTYTWTISGFTGTKTIIIGSNTRDYTAGDQLSTAQAFTFQLTDSSDIVSEPGAAVDFIITLTVSDGVTAKNDNLVLNFDID